MSIVHVDREQTADGEDQYTVIERDTSEAWPKDARFSVIGKPLPRVEGDLKVTGKAPVCLRCPAAWPTVCAGASQPASARADRADRHLKG